METQCVYCELGNELVYELEAFTGLQYWLSVRSIITSGSTEKQCNLSALRSQPYGYSTALSRHVVCLRVAVHWLFI
jgi:hypothetical protein